MQTGVSSSNTFMVNINDAVAFEQYQLADGTPISLASIKPFFLPGQPDDTAANTQNLLVIRKDTSGAVGFDDSVCSYPFGAICQIQLTT